MAILLYGVAIHKSAATGNLKNMKATLKKAEAWLARHGDVSAALELLNLEIAKAEARSKPKPKPIRKRKGKGKK